MSSQSKWTKASGMENPKDSVARNTRSQTGGGKSMNTRKGQMEADSGHCGGGDGSREGELENCDNCPEGSGTYIAGSHPGCKYAPYLGKEKGSGSGWDENGPFIAGSHPGCIYAPYKGNQK